MSDILTYVIAPVIIVIISAYFGYRLGIRKLKYERKVAKTDADIERFEKLLYHAEKIIIAANIPGEDEAKRLVSEASNWFHENCLPYRSEEPYKEFEVMMKWVAAYVYTPDVLAIKSLEMFEKLTELKSKIYELLKSRRLKG